MGDLNISPQDIDIGIGEENKKDGLGPVNAVFTRRKGNAKRSDDWGLFDSYRTLFPEKDDEFSWFDYRSKGFEDNPKEVLELIIFG